MDRVFIISKSGNTNAYNQADVDRLNTFLSKSENEDFEVKKVRELSNGELLIHVSDI